MSQNKPTVKKQSVIIGLFILLFSCINTSFADPCEEIIGHWAGSVELKVEYYCEWEVDAQGTMYEGTFRLQMSTKLKPGEHRGCIKHESYILSGTCKNSILTIEQPASHRGKGSVYGGFLSLENSRIRLQLNKK